MSNGNYLVADKEVSGFTNEEEDMAGCRKYLPNIDGLGQSCEEVLSARGAKFTKVDAWGPKVSIAGKLITGQNPACWCYW